MKRSTVDMAVLSVVIERPGHGYDVGTRFVARYRGLYRTTVQHVYSNLKRLRESGFIETVDFEADDAPISRPRAFRATGTGARTFRQWLADPISPEVARRELFTRLRAVQAVRPNDYRAMLLLLDRYEDAVLGSIGFVSAGDPVTIVDDLAREDHEATIEGQLRWSAAAREKLLSRIGREASG